MITVSGKDIVIVCTEIELQVTRDDEGDVTALAYLRLRDGTRVKVLEVELRTDEDHEARAHSAESLAQAAAQFAEQALAKEH